MNDIPDGVDRFFWDRWVSRDSRWWEVWFLGTAFAPAMILLVIAFFVGG